MHDMRYKAIERAVNSPQGVLLLAMAREQLQLN